MRPPRYGAVLGVLLASACALPAQSVFGTNLIVNPGAEAGPGDNGTTPIQPIPGWARTGYADVITYASDYEAGINLYDIIPQDHGLNMFYGGNRHQPSSLTQTVDLTPGATAINLGTVVYTVAGYLGGYGDWDDNSVLTVVFLGASSQALKTVTLGPVLAVDRGDANGMYLRRQIGIVPAGTTQATITLLFTPNSTSSENNGLADNLSLVLNPPSAPASLLNTNVIIDPGAESVNYLASAVPQHDIPGWVRSAYFDIDQYSDVTGDQPTLPSGVSGGLNYFYGGFDALSSAHQDIDVSGLSAAIDGSGVNFGFSGLLGGYGNQTDNAIVTADFENWTGTILGTTTLGPVTAAERNDITELLPQSQNGAVPAGTRFIHLLITLTRYDGSDNDGMVDNLSMVLTDPNAPSFGSVDTPANNSTGIAGAIGVTGWALSAAGIESVGVWRAPVTGETPSSNGLIFLANAAMVPGARPDVSADYPEYPQNNTGWGMQVLTNELPNSSGAGGLGNGTFQLHALATNGIGMVTDIGSTTITVDNKDSVLPFGTIDTPATGATASGASYVNFGWALTPLPAYIPQNGSTITVFIDAKPVGHPIYNNYRADIATLFPGLTNSNGAVGYYRIDTTAMTNGLHTISWGVTDSAGHRTGIGSRFFIVQN